MRAFSTSTYFTEGTNYAVSLSTKSMQLSRRQFAHRALLTTAGYSILACPSWAQMTAPYIVKKGDTLSHIAAYHGTTVSALKQANSLSSDMVRIGQKLHIPSHISTTAESSAITHTVSKGDTLSLIHI